MSDASIVTSQPRTDSTRARAHRLVAAWLAGAATPPDDDLRVQPLRDGVGDELCFCSGTFTWPPIGVGVDPADEPAVDESGPEARAHLE